MEQKKQYSLEQIRHSAAHIMADAVERLFPGVKMGIGPAIDNGFYYDFDFSECALEGGEQGSFLHPEALKAIEKEMKRIIKEGLPFERQEISKKEAEKLFGEKGQTYKLELLKELEDGNITIYRHGDFFDLCKGPHVGKTKDIKAIKLLSLAGAYWKGDEKNAMLQRIYGTAFASREELKEFLRLREEAQKRDHRKLGKELDLFSFNETMGAGLVLYHQKGAMLRQLVVDYITEQHIARGYDLISSPHIYKSDIWKTSGHYDYYRDNMYFFESEGQEYGVKPMNCPGHILVYSSRGRSYRDLPMRFFELGTVYRHEKSGVLHGLLRVRGFTQDDAHIFCLREQVEGEVMGVIDFVADTLNVFGFSEFEVELSTRPEKFIGTEKDWEEATGALVKALENKGLPYEVNEGDGAFYGPKIDIKLKDALGRAWQCATVQCDFALPERFDLKYTAQGGEEQRPIVLHRVILGSLERFIGALIEHYGGAFPLWLSPVQVKMVPITEDHVDYAEEIARELRQKGLRVEVDARDEKMQRKIRDAEVGKIPYMAVVGNKEKEEGTVSLRKRKDGTQEVMSRAELAAGLAQQVREKSQ